MGVVVFGLGGTIAMAGDTVAFTADQLVGELAGVDRIVDFRRVPGASLTFEDMHALLAAIETTEADGVVVLQGTDTLEETAYVLDLGYAGAMPVVVTGAMRNPTQAGPDGAANIEAAVRVAASPEARNRGCLVVFADEIHAPSRVRKTHSTSLTTFQSPNGGPLGYLAEGEPRFLNRLPRRFTVPRGDRTPRVGLVTIVFDDDGALLRPEFDGLVIAGLGVGHLPDRLVPVLEDLARTMPVVLASRTGAGSAYTFENPGNGLVSSGFLDPYKARILLRALLAVGASHHEISAAFGAAGGYLDANEWPY